MSKDNEQGGDISTMFPLLFPATVLVARKFVDATGATCYN